MLKSTDGTKVKSRGHTVTNLLLTSLAITNVGRVSGTNFYIDDVPGLL
jgi:hypothetical protein